MMKIPRPEIESVERIWDRAPHNAFTDLCRWRGRWYCAFREAASHALTVGKVRVLASDDGRSWLSAGLVAERGVDLRDPKLSMARDGSLEVLMGGSPIAGGGYRGRRPRISRSSDGKSWTRPMPVMDEGDWLWRSERRGAKSYGVSYRLPSRKRWTVHLCASDDGTYYHDFLDLGVGGKPNEATLRFAPDGRAIVLVRREAGDGHAWIGASPPPFGSWSWRDAGERLGGPNFVILPDGSMIAAARFVRRSAPYVGVCAMTERGFDGATMVALPSGGDCGYPGMVIHRGSLRLSYYSSHEGKTAIYLAVLRL